MPNYYPGTGGQYGSGGFSTPILGSSGGGGGSSSGPVKGQVMGGGVVYGYSGNRSTPAHSSLMPPRSSGGPSFPGSTPGPLQNWGPNGPSTPQNPSTPGGFPGFPGGEFKVDVERDKRLDDMYDAFGQYNKDLTAGADADATTAMGRQRDLISGMANEFSGMTAGKGTFGSGVGALGTARILNKGQQALASTNSQLAADARGKRLQAMGGQVQAANANANYLTGQQNYALNQWQAQQGAYNAAQNLAMNQQQNAWNNQMNLMNTFYSG